MSKGNRRSILAMLCMLFLQSACGTQSDTAVKVKNGVGPEPAAISGDGDDSGKALVQVIISGLSAVQFPGGIKSEMDLVNVYLPRAHGHGLKIWEGRRKSESDLEWIQIGEDMESDGTTSDLELSFPEATEGKLYVDATPVDVSKFPESKAAAKSVRWIVPQSDLDAPRLFIARGVDVVPLKHGRFETCGLVHPPKDMGKICKIQTEYRQRQRGASEYLIHRFTVSGSEISIELRKDGELFHKIQLANPIKFSPAVLIDGVSYSKVFDVRIENEVDLGVRAMETDHAKLLKPMFIQSAGTWSMKAPGCEKQGKEWNCDQAKCEVDKQPECLEYFADYYKDWRMLEGNNRPMCPMVEFP